MGWQLPRLIDRMRPSQELVLPKIIIYGHCRGTGADVRSNATKASGLAPTSPDMIAPLSLTATGGQTTRRPPRTGKKGHVLPE
jgi:hypothetical protein